MNSMCGGSRKSTYSYDNDSWPSEIPSRSGSIRMGPNRARLFCTEKRDVEIAYNDSFNLPRHALQGPEKSLPVCPSSVLKNT